MQRTTAPRARSPPSLEGGKITAGLATARLCQSPKLDPQQQNEALLPGSSDRRRRVARDSGSASDAGRKRRSHQSHGKQLKHIPNNRLGANADARRSVTGDGRHVRTPKEIRSVGEQGNHGLMTAASGQSLQFTQVWSSCHSRSYSRNPRLAPQFPKDNRWRYPLHVELSQSTLRPMQGRKNNGRGLLQNNRI